MRQIVVFLAGAALAASPVYAADELKFGPVPAWVVEQSIPSKATKASEAPAAFLLNDTQIRLEPGKITQFTELAIKVQSPDGLSAGNIAFPWQPAHDTVTVNKMHIIRDGNVIDVLKSGQTFTVARRETNMEAATLDGTLTANIQPEGLQVGDIINLAVTTEHVDPVMKGHVEILYGGWNGTSIELARAVIISPASIKLQTRESGLPPAQRFSRDGFNVIEFKATAVEPLILPKGAPPRFRLGRYGEASDFQNWSEVADLIRPLFDRAAVIPASGPLREELEAIRKSAKSPKERAEKALRLVEDRIRYVALLMGNGGYVPASAETTWSRRFGDCKGKSALLLALLRELGIEADAVAVNSKLGDALPQRLPMVGSFDHVIVRARIDGKTYWLDGTRTGDSDLDRLPVPDFRWGLPLAPKSALVAISPPVPSVPTSESTISIDASAGAMAPAPAVGETVLRGDLALAMKLGLASLSSAQRDQFLREQWKSRYELLTVKSVASAFDESTGEMRLSVQGDAQLDWSDGLFHVPATSVGFTPDFARPEGVFRDAPFATNYPSFVQSTVVLQLPDGFTRQQKRPPASVNETLAGIEYRRTTTLETDKLTIRTSERTVAREVSFNEARAAEARLRALADEDISLRLPGDYVPTEKDIASLLEREPGSARAYIVRGNLLLNHYRSDEAIADFDAALRLDPKSVYALANRAIANALKGDVAAAENDVAAVDAIEPGNPGALGARGIIAQDKGDFAAAIEFFSKSLAKEPANRFALLRRAQSYYALAKHDLALADTDKLVRDTPGWEEIRLLRANIFLKKGNSDAVRSEAESLVSSNPRSAYAWVTAGKIYARIDMGAEAMKAFDRALAIKPEAYVYINRSQVRPPSDRAGRIADLDAALKLEPDHPDALEQQAELLGAAGEFGRAIELYDRAAKAGSDTLDFRAMRAAVLYRAGRTAEAEKIFADLRAEAKTSNDFNNLCWDKATAGILLESALSDCREAVRLEPDSGNILDSLGFVLLRLGKLDEAIAAYDKAIASRNDSMSLMGRAIAYARKGDGRRAQADRAEALKLNAGVEARFAGYGLAFEETQKDFVSK